MLATRWHARGDVRVEQVPPLATPPPGWVRIRVEVCGICGTDTTEYTAGPILIPLPGQHVGEHGHAAPLTLGHEAAGVVIEAAPDTGLAVGTRVAVEGNIFCGRCQACTRHDYQLCDEMVSLGLMGDGGLAEQMLAPAYLCVPFDPRVSWETIALAEPLSVVVRAVRRAGVVAGTTVGVVGGGTIGQLAAQVARHAGARLTVVVEPHARRRELARTLGKSHAVDPADAETLVAELTDGIGLDTVIEAGGSSQAAKLALRLTRRGGRTVLLGVYDGAVEVAMMDLLMGERELVSSLSHTYDRDFTEAVRLLEAGAIDVAPLVTDHIAMSDVVEQGFGKLKSEPNEHLKILVYPGR